MSEPPAKKRKDQSLHIEVIETKPYSGQKPGTSGLRKKVVEFKKPHYLENFVQSIFDALPPAELKGCTQVVSGDGRYYNDIATQTIIRMAAANGVGKVIVGVRNLMSTPCVSAIIRHHKAYGGIVLTASHNPGGPDQDFGIKYNISNGGPAPEAITDAIYAKTTQINHYNITTEIPEIDFSKPNVSHFGTLEIEVVDGPTEYSKFMQTIFDFPALKKFLAGFPILFDAMHGVAGPFARKVLVEDLGVPSHSVVNDTPKEDFGGGHPDPNLTYAHDLVERMGLGHSHHEEKDIPEFGAAADGDADRNMVLGKKFFVTPSDSLAVLTANLPEAVPYFKKGLKGVARSMPTSQAVDRVAKALDLKCYEVPTGWKFFGNLMDDGKISLCGEESFGTGSDHIREKDGLWAVLCWLSVLQHKNLGSERLVSVEQIVKDHWKRFGRNYYSRYDYEEVDSAAANNMFQALVKLTEKYSEAKEEVKLGDFVLAKADEFTYIDPVDGSISAHQGLRFLMNDGSRFVFRLSGTGSVGATIRLYIEKYENDPEKLNLSSEEALSSLITVALEVSQLEHFTTRSKPTVIT